MELVVPHVFRAYGQVVDDPERVPPSLFTLKAIARGWHVSLADISTAFLHALVEGDFWVLPPVECYPERGVVWKLRRALYGLKSAHKLWQQHLAATLELQGFRRMNNDPNLYHNACIKCTSFATLMT